MAREPFEPVNQNLGQFLGSLELSKHKKMGDFPPNLPGNIHCC